MAGIADIVVSFGADYLVVAALITVAYGIIHLLIGSLQGMKVPMFALWLGLFRQGLMPVLLFPLLTTYMGIHGVWWGIFTSAWLSAAICYYYHRQVLEDRLIKPQ